MVRINDRLRVGRRVVVKYEDEDYEFLARIVSVKGNLCTVIDQEDNAFIVAEEDIIQWDPS